MNESSILGVTEIPTNREVDALLSAAEARTEARFISVEARFGAVDGKLDRLADILTGDHGLLAEMKSVKADNRNTRWTIAGIFVATMVGGLAALWSTQANLLSAFQAALAVKAAVIIPADADKITRPAPSVTAANRAN